MMELGLFGSLACLMASGIGFVSAFYAFVRWEEWRDAKKGTVPREAGPPR